MNGYFNYLIEANIALVLFFAAYTLLLRNETDFRINRIFLLLGLMVSLGFPLLHLQTTVSLPTLRQLVPTYILPEISVQAKRSPDASTLTLLNNFDRLFYLQVIYAAGVLFFLVLFLIQVAGVLRAIKNSRPILSEKFKIVESNSERPPFSFFHFIFIGQASSLTSKEKEKIIRHEMAHARQFHSLDILLVNIAAVFFWCNPILRYYKKTFIQLHEFEADSHAAEGTEVNEYCSLLAKVALLSADIKLANHFSNSLTLKRIEMMRTLKHKIKTWKILALACMVPLVFFIVACQDQVMDDLAEVAQNSNNALVVPDDIQARFEQLKKENPDANYVLLEFNEAGDRKLAELDKKYGVPKSIELYTPDPPPASSNTDQPFLEATKTRVRTFAIVQYNQLPLSLTTFSKTEDDVYNVVEETATPRSGLPGFYEYVMQNMSYPKSAREKGLEGKVFIEFVIQTDGSLSDFTVLKGVSDDVNQEALRVIKASPAWTPGKVKGIPVKQRMVMPINFSLGS